MSTTPSIEVKRHYRELSEKETDELVDAVADLIVDFLKKSCDPGQSDKPKAEQEVLA